MPGMDPGRAFATCTGQILQEGTPAPRSEYGNAAIGVVDGYAREHVWLSPFVMVHDELWAPRKHLGPAAADSGPAFPGIPQLVSRTCSRGSADGTRRSATSWTR